MKMQKQSQQTVSKHINSTLKKQSKPHTFPCLIKWKLRIPTFTAVADLVQQPPHTKNMNHQPEANKPIFDCKLIFMDLRNSNNQETTVINQQVAINKQTTSNSQKSNIQQASTNHQYQWPTINRQQLKAVAID